ncbi:hypothetical protein HDN1F_27250 [gamma proteobacterium HdN1]|nr:hypothetical protein HDN1F_27250 [gamma proteobacterium HdN1]
MTNKPPQATKPTTRDAGLPWYRVPVLWLGIFLTALVAFGCIHLIVISHRAAAAGAAHEAPASAVPASKDAGQHKPVTHVLGMPLSNEHVPAVPNRP